MTGDWVYGVRYGVVFFQMRGKKACKNNGRTGFTGFTGYFISYGKNKNKGKNA